LNGHKKERSFSAAFLYRTTVNMDTSSEFEEETDEEGVSKENWSREMDKTVAALEPMLYA